MSKEIMNAIVELVRQGGGAAVTIFIWIKVSEFCIMLVKCGTVFGIFGMFFGMLKKCIGLEKENK